MGLPSGGRSPRTHRCLSKAAGENRQQEVLSPSCPRGSPHGGVIGPGQSGLGEWAWPSVSRSLCQALPLLLTRGCELPHQPPASCHRSVPTPSRTSWAVVCGPAVICIQEPGLRGGDSLSPTLGADPNLPLLRGLWAACVCAFGRRLEDKIQILTIHLLSSKCQTLCWVFHVRRLTESSVTDEETDSERLGHLCKVTQKASASGFTDPRSSSCDLPH